MFRIGNQTAICAPTPMEPFEFALQSGFDAFEWFPDKNAAGAGWSETDLDQDARRSICNAARKHGIRLSVHAPWTANPLNPQAVPLLLQSLEFAQDVGAELLNIHLYAEQGIEAYVAAIAPLMARLPEAGLALSIENTVLTPPAQFNELFARIEQLAPPGADRLGMCFDVGHANLCESTRNNYLCYLVQLNRQVPIVHVHLHENWGDRDSHLLVFTGPASRDSKGIERLLERLGERNFSGSVILEQWPSPPSLLIDARDRLLQLMNDGQPAEAPALASTVVAAETAASPERSSASDGFLPQLAEGNVHARSWREKLELVRSLVAGCGGEITLEELIDLSVYLRFLGTGEVACVEDGRHFRPSHAAKASIEIQDALSAVTDPAKALVLRKIYCWLPSTDRAFTRAEPLTRIRDIAHRNDIPSDLKREIKNTLQNKLHRCAGPEDLVTSARILDRITAPGAQYSRDFVEQFQIFHEELKEFFSARSLDEQLRGLAAKVSPENADLIQRFLQSKEQLGEDIPQQVATLRLLTGLRRAFLASVRNNPGSGGHELRLADIALEDLAFPLLSRLLASLDQLNGELPWPELLEALTLTVSNVGLSGFSAAECDALEAELGAWRQASDPASREHILRVKATIERSRRLADDYSGWVMGLFPNRVSRLGRALEVAGASIAMFVEGDIRGSLVFQISELATRLTRNIRDRLNLSPWEVLVSGSAVGELVAAQSLAGLRNPPQGDVIALLRGAEGDEEISGAVRGIVLAHQIPHLSHLGVRARQRRVPFVTCEDTEEFERLEGLRGSVVAMEAGAGTFRLTPSAQLPPAQSKTFSAPGAAVRVPEVSLRAQSVCIPLDQATSDTGGGKASGLRRLAALARRDSAGFLTAPGLVVPFGVMESSLESAPAIRDQYRQLVGQVNGLPPSDFAATAGRLRGLIQQLEVPAGVVQAAVGSFDGASRIMVRSSANCEDLEQMAGAGLYDSIANVAPGDVADAVRRVWASLWTERAAMSRRENGIAHEQAHMAVVLQEMIAPDYSFIVHTVNPVDQRRDEAYVEIAVGLGEVLASATLPGTPYRMVCDKISGKSRILAFANFSCALRPDAAGGTSMARVRYSEMPLSRDLPVAAALGKRLAALARVIEEEFGSPQDIEGAIVGDQVYLVQSRPQQGLGTA